MQVAVDAAVALCLTVQVAVADRMLVRVAAGVSVGGAVGVRVPPMHSSN